MESSSTEININKENSIREILTIARDINKISIDKKSSEQSQLLYNIRGATDQITNKILNKMESTPDALKLFTLIIESECISIIVLALLDMNSNRQIDSVMWEKLQNFMGKPDWSDLVRKEAVTSLPHKIMRKMLRDMQTTTN